jgi:hypothetical protein
MNTFAWNVTLKWNSTIKTLDFDYVANLSKTWDKVLFVFWDTELKTSDQIIEMLTKKLWDLQNYDISISTEDKMELINDTYEEGVYELATFEWEQVDFAEIFDRFSDFDEVVSIREAEISEKFWNKVIKVDFVY